MGSRSICILYYSSYLTHPPVTTPPATNTERSLLNLSLQLLRLPLQLQNVHAISARFILGDPSLLVTCPWTIIDETMVLVQQISYRSITSFNPVYY